MSERLFLQFQDANAHELLWYHSVDEQIQQDGSLPLVELNELTLKFPKATVIVLVPSSDCLVTRVKLPTSQRRQQLKAIPFALEEQIADDIESMHFALGKNLDDGQLPVIAVAKNKMSHWLSILEQAEISVTAMLPLSILLDAPADAWSIYQKGDLYLINQNGDCWTAGAEEAAMMLNLSLQNMTEDEQPNLLYWGSAEIPDWIMALGLTYSTQLIEDPDQDLLARFNPQCINLLQGDFERQDDWGAVWSIWNKVAVLAIVTILLKFTLMGFDIYRLNSEQQYLKTEIAKTYHQVAPGARIVDPKKQMQQLLKQGRGAQNQSSSFLMMLSHVGNGIATIPGIRPTNLNYDSNRGEIRLDLLVSNLSLLDKLKANLVTKGLSIEVGGANAQGNDYTGRLIIRSGS